MNSAFRRTLLVALCIARFAQTPICHSATFLDYTGSYPFANSPLVAVTFASSFTVGSEDIQVNSIRFRLAGHEAMTYNTTGYILADAGSTPGAQISSKQRAFGFGEFTGAGSLEFYDYTFQTPLTLSAGNTYWAALGKADSGYGLVVNYTPNLSEFSANGVTPSLTHATTLSYPPDGAWGVNSPTMTLVYELEGSVVPEPSASAFAFLFIAFMAIVRFNASQSRLAI